MDVFLLLKGVTSKAYLQVFSIAFMSSSIDVDTVFIIIQIVIVFMLILGLPLARGAQNRKT